ncbi:hypothetical protein DE11_19580 [Salmonella enterica subsp. enterica serovar Hadar]|nr:hypothetical protein DE11_19580 [Salmonella enterica subsp. enterica serovar Hadar]OJI62229.1 hypothetical protein BKP32_24105 [Salmonella enterica subsp. enterica serovar Kentucky]
MAWVGAREWLPDNDVARLCLSRRYLAESIERHVAQIEVFTAQPPSVSALKIRQVNAAKMICVPEKRVAIHNAVVEPAPQQEWHRPVFPQFPARCKPPWQPRHYLHLPVSTRKRWLALRMRMEYCDNLPFFLRRKPVVVTYAEVMPGIWMHIPTAEHSLAIQDQRAYFILRRCRIIE